MKKFTVALLIFAGCATTQLNENAKKVTVAGKSEIKLEDRKKLEEIGPVSCSVSYNGRELDTNIVSCKNELRNKAAEMGASIVVIEEKLINGHNNTVRMVGTGFKEKESK